MSARPRRVLAKLPDGAAAVTVFVGMCPSLCVCPARPSISRATRRSGRCSRVWGNVSESVCLPGQAEYEQSYQTERPLRCPNPQPCRAGAGFNTTAAPDTGPRDHQARDYQEIRLQEQVRHDTTLPDPIRPDRTRHKKRHGQTPSDPTRTHSQRVSCTMGAK